MLKKIVFYAELAAYFIASFLVWGLYPPKFKVTVRCDRAMRRIQCQLTLSRSFRPLTITGIVLPASYVEAWDASPPPALTKFSETYTAEYPEGGAEQELVSWEGEIEASKGDSVELEIPAIHPDGIPSGTLRFRYSQRGVSGIGETSSWFEVPFSAKTG